MRYLVVGLSHRTAPVEVRERIAVPAADLPELLRALCDVGGIGECLLLSTCNRTEVYAHAEDPEREAGRLRAFLAEVAKSPLEELAPYLYDHQGEAAVGHVFRVASSLDSMVVGESQILGQVKAAYAAAQAAEAARGRLARLMDRAFALAKRVRTETSVGASTTSVSGAAVDLARNIFGDLAGRSVLLIGAGEMGRLTLEHLRSAGIREIVVANRSEEKALDLVRAHPGVAGYAVPLERVLEPLERVDIALSSVQMGRYVLDREGARALVKRRRGRPLFLVDIAVPRSLDPAVHDVENVFLYDIDDLEGIVAASLRARQGEALQAERLVEAEVVEFVRGLKELDVAPAVKALLDRLEAIRTRELAKHLARARDLTPEARDAVEAATRAMMGKVAHGPIQELKRAVSSPDGLLAIETLRRALLPGAPGEAGDGKAEEPEHPADTPASRRKGP